MRNVLSIICSVLAFNSLSANAETKTFVKRQAIKVNHQSCEAAYKAAKASPSTGTVSDATDTCEKATVAACTRLVESSSDGPSTGDGRYIASVCEASAAYGANKAVNSGIATKACKKAYESAPDSGSKGDEQEAAQVCNDEKDKACIEMVNKTSDGPNTGDGRLINASCYLLAAHGAYLQVKAALQVPKAPVEKATKANSKSKASKLAEFDKLIKQIQDEGGASTSSKDLHDPNLHDPGAR